MARPREFDDAAVLDAAIDCFWAEGFGGTSIRDLSERMGISGPSLYNAFGDKHGLFIQSIERYLDPEDPRFDPASTATNKINVETESLEDAYRFRVVANKRFMLW